MLSNETKRQLAEISAAKPTKPYVGVYKVGKSELDELITAMSAQGYLYDGNGVDTKTGNMDAFFYREAQAAVADS
jgi:hypothetical protein